MESIFELADRSQHEANKFWIPYESTESDVEIFNSQLIQLSKNDEKIVTENYSLTAQKLIKNSSNRKMALIEWKQILPFIEENDDKKRFGFRLGHTNCYQDFYVSTQEQLETWLEHLSKVCIITDIEDDFTIIKKIGKGCSSSIYLGVSNENNNNYAIKAIMKNFIAKNQANIEGVLNEIKILRKLNHPNILKLHRVYESEDRIYLVLDYLEGGDLFSRIMEKDRFPESTVLKLCQGLLSVVHYLSKQKIAHRDIKLENIVLVSRNNEVDFKLIDFGLASEVKQGLTQICGSPGYIAPEILRGYKYGSKADLFSVGAVAYILIAGKMPFFGRTAKEILIKNRDGFIHLKGKIWNEISRDAINLIVKLTDPNPGERISASDALKHPWFKNAKRISKDSIFGGIRNL